MESLAQTIAPVNPEKPSSILEAFNAINEIARLKAENIALCEDNIFLSNENADLRARVAAQDVIIQKSIADVIAAQDSIAQVLSTREARHA